MALHLVVAVAIHLRALAHVRLHLKRHVATTGDECLTLRVELLTIVTTGNRMLITVWLAVVGIGWKLAVCVWLRLRRRHGSVVKSSILGLVHRVLRLLVRLWPALT